MYRSFVNLNSLKRSFSASRSVKDAATCQLLGKFGTTPTKFTTSSGRVAARYVFAVNRGPPESQTTSWFNVVAFNEQQIERLTSEDLKGAKALINGALDVQTRKE